MSREVTKEDIIEHKENALKKLDEYISSLIESDDPKIYRKADKLSFWLEDWTTFLDFENDFSPTSLRRYKRGEIVKAHLGYNVGSEEGGLHYCVVIEKNNSKNSPVVAVVPLTSLKAKTDLKHLHKGTVYLGNELFRNLNSKISFLTNHLNEEIDELRSIEDSSPTDDEFQSRISNLLKELGLLSRIRREVSKMKIGSIALVSQIRTISKIRIYDPKTNHDILSNIKLSDEKLDLIDEEILKLFIGKTYRK